MRALETKGRRRLRRILPAIAATLCTAVAASAQAQEFEKGGFGRKGFYVGVGASFGFPVGGWSDGDESGMSQSANSAAQANANQIEDDNANLTILGFEQVRIKTSGLDLDDARFGLGGVVGYRLSPLASLEVEGEWLANNGRSNFTIRNGGDTGTAEVKDLWALTANVRVYPWSGRFQPFGVFGIGLLNSHVDLNVAAPNVTTTATQFDNNGNTTTEIVLPAGFELVDPATDPPTVEPLVQNRDSTDGAFRVGLGLDAYLTENVAAELKADYVYPFSDNGFVSTQYLSLRVGLLYRF